MMKENKRTSVSSFAFLSAFSAADSQIADAAPRARDASCGSRAPGPGTAEGSTVILGTGTAAVVAVPPARFVPARPPAAATAAKALAAFASALSTSPRAPACTLLRKVPTLGGKPPSRSSGTRWTGSPTRASAARRGAATAGAGAARR